MKKFYLIAAALLCGFSAFSQTESPITLVSGGVRTGYDNFNTAVSALAENDSLIINQDVTYNAVNGRPEIKVDNVTITGATPDVVLTLQKKDGVFIIIKSSNVTISNITLDGYAKDERTGSGFEIQKDNSVIFKNVKFQNYNFAASATNRGIIAPQNNGKWTLDNCSFENITNGRACALANAGCAVTGTVKGCSIYVNGNNSIDAAGLEGTEVALQVDDTRTMGNNLVTNCTNTSLFKLLNEGMYLEVSGNNIQINKQSTDVVNETSGIGYATLAQAVAGASKGDVLVVNAAQTLTSRLTIGSKKLTIKAGTDGVIKRGGNGMMLCVNDTSEIAFEGITFDGGNVSSTAYFVEVSKNKGTYALASFKNCKFINTDAPGKQVVQVKNGGRVRIEGCTAENNTTNGEFFIGNGTTGNALIGTANNFGIFYEGSTVTVAYEDAAEQTAAENASIVTLYFDPERTNKVLVTGAADPANFKSGVDGYKLVSVEGGIAFESNTDAVDAIEVEGEDVKAEYYNLQGIRVMNPDKGVYIVKKGNKVSKVAF